MSLTAYVAAPGTRSVTLLYPSGLRLAAERLRGEDWPFVLFVALGPPDPGPFAGLDRIEIELPDGILRIIEYD